MNNADRGQEWPQYSARLSDATRKVDPRSVLPHHNLELQSMRIPLNTERLVTPSAFVCLFLFFRPFSHSFTIHLFLIISFHLSPFFRSPFLIYFFLSRSLQSSFHIYSLFSFSHSYHSLFLFFTFRSFLCFLHSVYFFCTFVSLFLLLSLFVFIPLFWIISPFLYFSSLVFLFPVCLLALVPAAI